MFYEYFACERRYLINLALFDKTQAQSLKTDHSLNSPNKRNMFQETDEENVPLYEVQHAYGSKAYSGTQSRRNFGRLKATLGDFSLFCPKLPVILGDFGRL